jgi:hypothetical protein
MLSGYWTLSTARCISGFFASPSRGEGRTPLAWTAPPGPSNKHRGGPSHMAFGVGVPDALSADASSCGREHPHLTRHDELVHPMEDWATQLMTRLPPPSPCRRHAFGMRGRRASRNRRNQLRSYWSFLKRGRLAFVLAVVTIAGISNSATAQSKKETAPQATAQPSPAKPKVPAGSDPGGVAVAIIGSGVNYTLPQIANRLARDGEGDIIGLDFIDRDNRPFDVAGPDATADGIRPYGTTLASVVLYGAPRVNNNAMPARLVPVRLPTGDPRALGGATAFIASTRARIALVAFTSPNRGDWEAFEQVAKTAPNILFVFLAGDTGQDLDKQPLYPASLQLPNAIVVTSADGDGRLAPEANRGPGSVDVAAIAIEPAALSFEGSRVEVRGSNYAAARVAGLAAALLAQYPKLSTVRLKEAVLRNASPIPSETLPSTRHGAILLTGEHIIFRFGDPHKF